MSETDAAGGPPPFEDTFSSDDVEQRIYGSILQTCTPTTVSAITDSADCDPKAARKGDVDTSDILTARSRSQRQRAMGRSALATDFHYVQIRSDGHVPTCSHNCVRLPTLERTEGSNVW